MLRRSDPRFNTPECQQAILKKLNGLKERKVFEIVNETDVNHDDDYVILGGKLIVALKNVGTIREQYKTRFVALGNHDPDTLYQIHYAPTVKHRSIRIQLTIDASNDDEAKSVDMDQAFTQGSKPRRSIYLRPSKEFGLRKGSLLSLLRYIYGTAEAGDAWDVSITGFITDKLKLIACTLDVAFFYEKSQEGQLLGTLSKFVYYMIFVGNQKFLEHIGTLKAQFVSKPPSPTPFTYSGMLMEKQKGSFYVSQQTYSTNIIALPDTATFHSFTSLRHRIAWLSKTRPDITAPVNILAQTTESKLSKDSIRDIDNIVTKCHKHRTRKLKYQPI